MPYISRKEVVTKGEYTSTSGQRNFLITNLIIDRWLAKPRYETVEEIAHDFFDHPEHNDDLRGLMRGSSFAKELWYRSSRRAYEEFYRRVASKYEDQKSKTHGNVDPYIERFVLWPGGITQFSSPSYGKDPKTSGAH